ncbi:hypothetical protein GWI33_008486 [Rhynchophorus ferrugineus]|uniref:Uncharacterized protein n=1 Tax=Rhynchophorus ferrugineus TaxID=354439 RepID=A0A834MC64_RHYFE|nr:hypothetical protein GWI33_008486 [Rhynchophorus ferrugineus]
MPFLKCLELVRLRSEEETLGLEQSSLEETLNRLKSDYLPPSVRPTAARRTSGRSQTGISAAAERRTEDHPFSATAQNSGVINKGVVFRGGTFSGDSFGDGTRLQRGVRGEAAWMMTLPGRRRVDMMGIGMLNGLVSSIRDSGICNFTYLEKSGKYIYF